MFVKHSKSIRKAVVQAYHDGEFTVRKIAQIFQIGIQTICRWLRRSQQIAMNIPIAIASHTVSKITPSIEDCITRKVRASNCLDVAKMIERITRRFNTTLSRSTIYRCLHKNGLSYKKAHFRTKRADPVKLVEFYRQVALKSHNQIISLDEASFDTHMTPLYGWSPKGEKCILYPKHSRRPRKRFSLLMAISNSQVIAWQLIDGSYNKQLFLSFLNDCLFPNMNPSLNTILMDNVRFHHSREVKQLIAQQSMEIIYNPPYYPDTNPVEMVFSMLKASSRKCSPSTIQETTQVIYTCCSSQLSANVLSRTFAHALQMPI